MGTFEIPMARGPVDSIEAVDRRLVSGWHGHLRLVFVAETGVHIGRAGDNSRIDTPGHGDVVDTLRSVNDRPIIPGATMKGAIRSRAEALSCSRPADERQVRLDRCRRIFGSLDYGTGVLSFTDFVLDEGGATEGKASIPLFLRTGSRPEHFLFFDGLPERQGGGRMTALRTCTGRFVGALLLDGITDEDLGLVLLALGLDENAPMRLQLGRGKYAGLGMGFVEAVTLRLSPTFHPAQMIEMSEWTAHAISAYRASNDFAERSGALRIMLDKLGR